jgi:hypothetical protein
MADEEDIAALVIDNGSGMCKGKIHMCLNVFDCLERSFMKVGVALGHSLSVSLSPGASAPECTLGHTA